MRCRLRSRPYSVILVKVFDNDEFEVNHPGEPMRSDRAAAVLRAAADLAETPDRSPGLSAATQAWLDESVGEEAALFIDWHVNGQDVIEA